MQIWDEADLVAEIKERIETYNKGYANGDDRRADALDILLHDLDTLEVKEVDLENEIENYFKGWSDDAHNGVACHYQYVDLQDCKGIAKHFFELGLKTKEEVQEEPYAMSDTGSYTTTTKAQKGK